MLGGIDEGILQVFVHCSLSTLLRTRGTFHDNFANSLDQ